MNNIYMLIFAMMIVTYLPRLLPFILIGDRQIPVKLKEFLSYIPYAALGALIIPGFITAIPGHYIVSIVGILTAMILAYFKGGVLIPVMGSILACMMLMNFGL